MNHFRLAIATATALFGADAATAAEWHKVAPPELGFSVDLPGPVQTRSNNQEPDVFSYEDEYLAAFGSDGIAAVIAMQYRLDVLQELNAKAALQRVVDTYTGACGGTASQEEVPVERGYALSITRDCAQEGISYRTFAWLDGIIVYRVVVAGPDADVTGEEAERIFSSFELVD